MFAIFIALIGCLIGAAVSCSVMMLAIRKGKSPVNNVTSSAPATPTEPVNPRSESAIQFDSLVNSICELTSNIDSQVGAHSLRIGEITSSLESPHEAGPALVLFAGKMLVSANQKLQEELVEAKAEIERQREQMATCILETRTDALTGIMNRRGFEIELNRSFAQFRRDGTNFSILILDIDHFKRINDRYGHMVGDQILKGFARCLTSTFRETDYVARFGGEEFVAILPKTTLFDAFRAAERVREIVASYRFKAGELELQLTASIGVKEVVEGENDAELLKKVDEALYAAKNGGRNSSCFDDGTNWAFALPQSEVTIAESRASDRNMVEDELVSV